MKLELNVETLEVLLADRSAEVHGGTGLRCVRPFLKGSPLGQSSDLCCRSGSCPRPAQPAPAPTPKFDFRPAPPSTITQGCVAGPQFKKGPTPSGKR